jgi:CRISPR-associated protein Cas1
VDYKRGSPPDNPERSWEPERVQLCLQGLLLRENGYECDEGVLFFRETQDRITVRFPSDVIAGTLELLSDARRVAESGTIPRGPIEALLLAGIYERRRW